MRDPCGVKIASYNAGGYSVAWGVNSAHIPGVVASSVSSLAAPALYPINLDRCRNRQKNFAAPCQQARDAGTQPARTMSNSFAEFLARLHNRDDAAARELFGRFAHQLLALARRRINPALRHKVDPEDVV